MWKPSPTGIIFPPGISVNYFYSTPALHPNYTTRSTGFNIVSSSSPAAGPPSLPLPTTADMPTNRILSGILNPLQASPLPPTHPTLTPCPRRSPIISLFRFVQFQGFLPRYFCGKYKHHVFQIFPIQKVTPVG